MHRCRHLRVLKKMSTFTQRMDNGSVSIDSISYLIGIVIFTILLLVQIGWTGDIVRNAKIDDISRDYIMQMDDTGCLTADIQTNLTNDLTRLGCRNITYYGSTTTSSPYGEWIYLKVSYELPMSSFDFSSGIFHFRQMTTYISSGFNMQVVSRK